MSKRFHWRDIYALSYCYRVWGAVALVLITAIHGQALVDPVTWRTNGSNWGPYFDWSLWIITSFGPAWVLATAMVFPRGSRITSVIFAITIFAAVPLNLLTTWTIFLDIYIRGKYPEFSELGPNAYLPLFSVAVAIAGSVLVRFCATRPGWKTISRTKLLIVTALITYVLSLPFILMGADAWMTWLRSTDGNSMRFTYLVPLFVTVLPVGFSSLGKGFWQAAGLWVLGYFVAFPIVGSLMAVQPDTELPLAILFCIVVSTLTQVLVYSDKRVSESRTASDWLQALAKIMLVAIAVVLFEQFFGYFYRS